MRQKTGIRMIRIWGLLCLAAVLCLGAAAWGGMPAAASAAGGYTVMIRDECDLLTAEEEDRLRQDMAGITDHYCGAAFVTTRSSNAESTAEAYFREFFGRDSAVLFLIDMQDREIRIFSDGAAYRQLTTGKANTITDNVYTYASKGRYYECAAKAFYQMERVLAGKPIAEPMRYIGCAMIAVIVSVLINFAVAAAKTSHTKVPSEVLEETAIDRLAFGTMEKTAHKKTRSRHVEVVVGGGGGSGGGGGGGFGGGGGGSSGGGGGHSF